MDKLVINGGGRLKGAIRISGAKNAALPIMAASLLSEGANTIRDAPDLADIRSMGELLADLGVSVSRGPEDELRLKVEDEGCCHAQYDRVRKMRASICVLGPLLAKRCNARVSMPGGCAIGSRPVDLHLRGLEALGAEIELDGGDIVARAKKLTGANVFLGGPFGSTVLGTANVMMAATLAKGRTVIESAACEPEVTDLADYLNAMGAQVSGAGTPRVIIEGVEELAGAEHRVIPDRIEAGTFAIAAALTNGDVTFQNVRLDHMMAVADKLRQIGVILEPGGDGGIRGFMFAEINLPDVEYAGDLVVGNAHLKAGQGTAEHNQRIEAAQNIAYLIDYWFNGAGTGSPDPNGKINDSPPATQILGNDTPVIWGGDWNEDEATNGRDGPALWMVRAQSTQNDGTDRDRSDSVYDTATDPISGSRNTSSWGKLDYIGHQDSIATQRLGFVFNSASLSSSQRPPELNNFPNPSQASSHASDHWPVIGDFEVAVLSGNDPLPDIKINGQDGPINIPDTQPVTMTIHLDPGDYQGTTMDWWILAEKLGGDTYSWVYPGSWKFGTRRAIAYPLIPIASYTIHTGTIPQGMWTIAFSLDTFDNVHQGTFKDEIYVSSYE